MQYLKYQPHSLLHKFIDCYWVLQTDSSPLNVPLFSDANTDLFMNLGNTKENFAGYMPGRMYLRGPATSAHFCNCLPSSVYIGIRFKPGGLPLFYHVSLPCLVDQAKEFHDRKLALILDVDEFLPKRLDEYFLKNIKLDSSSIAITEAVYLNKGRISVDLLAKASNVSNRTLERYFFTNMGIGPKEFINIVRFKHLILALQNYSTKEFAGIALEMGFYDQSHFIKEIKKRGGVLPTSIFPIPEFP